MFAFQIGPPIGAYFASRPVELGSSLGIELNVYAAPAILTLVLLLAETAFLHIALPETRGKGPAVDLDDLEDTKPAANGHALKTSRATTVEKRLSLLKSLRKMHFLFLGLFSGVEFTLTFLTFDRESLRVFLSMPHIRAIRPDFRVDNIICLRSYSIRLEQHTKRKAHRIHRYRQCTSPRRIRPSCSLQSRRT